MGKKSRAAVVVKSPSAGPAAVTEKHARAQCAACGISSETNAKACRICGAALVRTGKVMTKVGLTTNCDVHVFISPMTFAKLLSMCRALNQSRGGVIENAIIEVYGQQEEKIKKLLKELEQGKA